MLFQSVDIGTSAVKMAILDEIGRVRQTSSAQYPHQILPSEKNEILPDHLWEGCYRASRGLDVDLRARVDVLCYDTFSPSPVLVMDDGTLAYPNLITHMDRRSRAQSVMIDQIIGNQRFLDISGILPFPGGSGAMTFLWFRQNHPEILDRASFIGHLPTYVHHRLTGEQVVDLVNASMMGLYETTTQAGWSQELLDGFDIDRQLLPEIRIPGELLGTLCSDEAQRLGLKSGIPVAVGTNDMAAAQVGAGNVTPGSIMNTAGSSDMVSILADKPVTSEHYYLRNSAIPGIWQIYATTAGGFALDWFHRQVCADLSDQQFYGEFILRALEQWVSDGEVTFEPYLTGDRQSLERRTGAWNGLTLAATREEMLAAMLKSMNRVLNATVAKAREVVDLASVIKITGGMASPAILALKRREFTGFDFEVVDNCGILGNVALVGRHIDS